MRRRETKLGLGFLGSILVGLLVVGCAAPPAAAPTPVPAKAAAPAAQPTPVPKKVEKVKLAIPTKSASLWWTELGRQKGFFKEENIDLEVMVVKADISYPAVVAREIDYTTAIGGAFQLAMRGAPIRVIMNTGGAGVWDIYGAPGVESVQYLKGKVVTATSRGTSSEYAVRVTLSRLGLNPDKDVTFVYIPGGADNLAALRSKSVAAALLVVPFSVMASDDGLKKLAALRDHVDFPGNGLSTNLSRLKDNPDNVKRVLKASLKSLAYYRDHPDEIVEFLAKEFAMDKRVAKISYDDLMGLLVVDGDITRKQGEGLIDLVVFQGEKREQVSLEKGVDLTLLKEAQKELKISQ